MKKIIRILAVMVLLLSLCGCKPGDKEPEKEGLSMEELLQKLEDNGNYAEYDTYTMLYFQAKEKKLHELEIVDISNYYDEELDILDVQYEGNNTYRMEIAYGSLQTDVRLIFSDPELTGFILKDGDGNETTYVLDKGYELDELLAILEKGNDWLEPDRRLMCSFSKSDKRFILWLAESSWGGDGTIETLTHYGVDCYGLWLKMSTASMESTSEAKLTEVQIKLGRHPEESIRMIMDDLRFNINTYFYANEGASLK